MFAYSSRTDVPICTKLCMLIPRIQEENTEGSKLQKSVLSSSLGDGGSSSSETKHDRRTAPSNVCSEEITGTKTRTPKTVLCSSPGEDGFCRSETKHDRRTALIPKLFHSARLQDQRP
jgi:hypothetical protein